MRFIHFTLLLLLTLPPLVDAQDNVSDSSKFDQLISANSLDRSVLASAVLVETNRCRVEAGREPLEWLAPLGVAARDHATAMTTHGFFAHQNKFDREQRTLSDRISRVGLEPAASAENIAMTFAVDFGAMRDWMREGGQNGVRPKARQHTYRTFARSLVKQWMDSPGHRKNIMNGSLRYIGLGFATMRDAKGLDRFYCVQNFCAPERQVAMSRRHVGLL